MKRIVLILFATVTLYSCSNELPTDDYISYDEGSYWVDLASPYFYDNNGKKCRQRGVSSEWLIESSYKTFDGEGYGLYIAPEVEIFYQTKYRTYLSEIGWVKLDDILNENIVTHIKDNSFYLRHEKI